MNIDTPLIPRLKNKYSALFILLFLPIVAIAATKLPDEITSGAGQVVDLVCKEEFKPAEDAARKIIKKYPESPVGYFFMAVVLDSWMCYHLDNRKEDEFYKYCDLAVEKSEVIIGKKSDDEWALFFMGGAEGYKGTYESRYERWITAFRYGWKGVSILMKLSEMKSDIEDINYGIGSYDYWRSALMKTLWWMPGVKDRREDGIKKLYLATENGLYTRLISSAALIDVLVNENRFEEALPIAQKMLKTYPSSSMFLWGEGKSLFGVGRFDEARQIFTSMLKKYESEEIDNHYYCALCHFWLAKVNYAQQKYQPAIQEISVMETYKLDDDLKKLLEKYFSEGRSIKKKSIEELDKK
jgi:tetratricopeptide (TPR) repeat protein